MRDSTFWNVTPCDWAAIPTFRIFFFCVLIEIQSVDEDSSTRQYRSNNLKSHKNSIYRIEYRLCWICKTINLSNRDEAFGSLFFFILPLHWSLLLYHSRGSPRRERCCRTALVLWADLFFFGIYAPSFSSYLRQLWFILSYLVFMLFHILAKGAVFTFVFVPVRASICPASINSAPAGRIFLKFGIWGTIMKICFQKIQIWLKSGTRISHLTWKSKYVFHVFCDIKSP